jgi:nucleoside 2-deoxyribosyltransferase
MNIYLAGPMRGILEFNFPAFADATATLRNLGLEVFSPAERDLDIGFDPTGMTGDEDLAEYGFDLSEALGADLHWITTHADAVIVLPGWERSSGVAAEMATAKALGIPVYLIGDFIRAGRYCPEVTEYGMTPKLEVDYMTPERQAVADRLAAQATPITFSRAAQAFEELRTVSATGGEKGRKLCEVGAIDPLAREELGKVAGFGSRKYARNNYLKGYDWSLCVDALHRHMIAFESGEDRDPESGLLHVAHAAWHGLALASFILRDIGTDDRSQR